MKTKVLVSGGNGQLARTIRSIASQFESLNFEFVDVDELDITNSLEVDYYFSKNKIDWCINCAAYTAVDKAESEPEKAKSINVLGVKILTENCKKHHVKLVHISTDFVFSGDSRVPYNEDDATHPLSVYGKTKLDGEIEIINGLTEYFIFRTSWLYSEYGNNFLKTMLRLATTKDSLNVVNDQIGCPTYAKDLALLILRIISENSLEYGLYHYCNKGEISWYDFARSIFDISHKKIQLNPISTSDYPTAAKRPQFSALDTSKTEKTFQAEIPFWKDSLKIAIDQL